MQHLKLTPLPAPHRYPLQSLHHQRGMTLVEWMVSITIGLVLLAGLTALIARQSSTQAELEKSSRQIENGRYAMQLLNEDIQLAGYYGEFSNVSALAVPGTLPDPCLTAVSDLESAMAFSVQGYDSPATGLSTCIAAANHVSGTDILVVRRVEPATLTIAAAAAAAGGQVYLQSGLTASGLEFSKKLGTGADASGTSVFTLFNKDGTTLASLRKFLVHIYFVSPCSVMSGAACSGSDDGGKPIPTLKMMALSASGGTTTMSTTPLVEGIENMQIDYGIDTTGDGAPDGQFVATTAAVADWANLVALRVHLLARNNESSAGYVDPKTYVMGYNSAATAQTITPATDSYGNNVLPYKRRLFSQLIRVVNPSSRRDQ
ncbi:MAG: PilW family protein [Polaromonas sp.]